MKKRRPGTSKAEAAQRRALFVEAYCANGGNAMQAAISAGYSASSASARAKGSMLLKEPDVAAAIKGRMAKALESASLTVDRTLLEVARLAYFDKRKLYREDGTIKPPSEWDDDTAAAVAGAEVDEIKVGSQVVGQTVKVKTWDKNAALDKAMKHLGLYEKDNKQKPVPVLPPILNIIAVPGGR